jgi:hypothetical protein
MKDLMGEIGEETSKLGRQRTITSLLMRAQRREVRAPCSCHEVTHTHFPNNRQRDAPVRHSPAVTEKPDGLSEIGIFNSPALRR